MLAVVFGLLALLVVCEMILTVVNWPIPGLYVDDAGPQPLLPATENGGAWRGYEGTARLRHWDYDVALEINSHGFRERQLTPKARGTWRIGVFGDGLAAGRGVKLTERFVDVWRVSAGLRSEDVYNLASTNAGTAANAAFFRKYGHAYGLDELIVALYGGDELADNRAYPAVTGRTDEQLRAAEANRPLGLRGWLRRHFKTAGFFWVKGLSALARANDHTIPTAQVLARDWPHTEAALQTIRATAGSRPMTIWYLPPLAELSDTVFREHQTSRGLQDHDRHALLERIRAWATRHNVRVIDLSPAFEKLDVEALHFETDGGWTAEAHAIVGRYLAAQSFTGRARP